MTEPQPLIDVHAHFTTPSYIEKAKAAGNREPDGMPEAYWPDWTPERHLQLMDEAGIGLTLLSLSSPGVHFGEDAAARSLAREMNDFAAEVSTTHPDRFGYFAVLPLPDVEGSLAEVDRTFDTMGARGAIVKSNNHGLHLGAKRLSPVLTELNRRSAVVLLHPTSCVGHEMLSDGRPQPMIEFLFESGRTVVDFILSGAAEAYPQIRLIVPHAGGVLPLLAERVELFRSIAGEPADRRTVDQILGGFHFDLAGTPTVRQLAALRTVAGPDRLLYGSDYAWTQYEQVLRATAALDLLASDDELKNWRDLTTNNARTLLAPEPH
jgi:predicted TIM-barrel fold metal-dependent hydrolase